MIILLKEHANPKQVDNLTKFLKSRGFELHMSQGTPLILCKSYIDGKCADIV